jgi:flagellar assembly factor FliW
MKANPQITASGVEWTEDQVIHFPSGLPGFENARKFIIMSVPEHQPFHWMECVDGGNNIRFAVINPLSFRPDYQPKIKKEELASLNIQDPKHLLLYVIVTLRKPLVESTANLMGPLINIHDRVGKQIIIENDAYSLRERIIP